jgi:hypothetical protein
MLTHEGKNEYNFPLLSVRTKFQTTLIGTKNKHENTERNVEASAQSEKDQN